MLRGLGRLSVARVRDSPRTGARRAYLVLACARAAIPGQALRQERDKALEVRRGYLAWNV